MALQWNGINFKTGEIHITRQVYRAKGKLRIADLKTTQSERTIIRCEKPNEFLRFIGSVRNFL